MTGEFDGDLFDGGGAQLSDHQAERQLVGYLILKLGAMTETIEIIRPENFHDPFNRRLYEILLHAWERGDEVTMASMVAALGGEASAGKYIAAILANVDHSIDASEVADHLFNIAERRMIGGADDMSDPSQGLVSRFGGQRWEEIGTTGNNNGYSWLIEDIVPMGEITLVYGDSGSGKSFNVFDMSMAIARGLRFNEHNVEPGLVVYVAAEAGKGFAKRKLAYVLHHGLGEDQPLPFYLCTKRPDFFSSDDDVTALIAEITAVCKTYRVPLVLIVLDTLSALAPGMNENASADVSKVRARLVRINDHFNAATLLVHHKPKGGSTPRGHGSLTADFETTIEFESLPGRKRATVQKQREGKKGVTWEFSLPIIKVGLNKWGNDETSCVVIPFFSQSSGIGFRATQNELAFLQSLLAAVDDFGVPPPPGVSPLIARAVDIAEVRTAMRSRMISGEDDPIKADNRFRSAFKRAGDALQRGAIIGYRKPLCWYTGKPVHGLFPPVIDGE